VRTSHDYAEHWLLVGVLSIGAFWLRPLSLIVGLILIADYLSLKLLNRSKK